MRQYFDLNESYAANDNYPNDDFWLPYSFKKLLIYQI